MAVLDSSVIIPLIAGGEKGENLRKKLGEEMFSTTTISLYEVFLGLTEKQRQSLKPYFQDIEVLPFDPDAAFQSIEIDAALLSKGRPIGKLDTFIAAICITNDLPLVTMDAGFKNVEGLKVIMIK